MTAPFVNAPGQWEEGALRWNFYDLNVLGDVAVRPWLDEPFNPNIKYDATLSSDQQSTEVVVKDNNGAPQKGFRCSLMYNDKLVGFAITNEEGVAVIDFENEVEHGNMKLYVTGLNAFPQVYDVAYDTDGIETIEKNIIAIYPNPNKGMFNVRLDD